MLAQIATSSQINAQIKHSLAYSVSVSFNLYLGLIATNETNTIVQTNLLPHILSVASKDCLVASVCVSFNTWFELD